jgi:hypothetical protein
MNPHHRGAKSKEKAMATSAFTTRSAPARRVLRSTGAVLTGFFSVALLSLGTDVVLHALDIYPPWGEAMRDPGLNLLALSYRILYAVAGGYLTAALSPYSPMRHVIVLAVLGFVAGSAGAVAAITVADLGPDWYPIALALSAFPSVWFGGRVHSTT